MQLVFKCIFTKIQFMISPGNPRILMFGLFALLISSCSEKVIQTTVFSDGFGDLETGALPRKGSWPVATALRYEGFDEAWQIRPEDGGGEGKILAQTFHNLDSLNEPLSLITHPMVVAGDSLWDNFTIEVEFTPLDKFDKCGLVFGYQHANEFFFFGTEGNTVTLKHIQPPVTPLRPIERILEYRPLVWTPGTRMRAVVTVRRNKISTLLNDSIRMYTEVAQLRPGKVGLISDMPARFSRVEVKMLKGELRQLDRKRRQLVRRQEIHISAHPEMIRWKTLDIAGVEAGRVCRLGDLTGDGNREIILAGPEAPGSKDWKICAMDLGGDLLWTSSMGRTRFHPGDEMPLQVHDLDGNGKREVVYLNGGRIRVLEGSTGNLLMQRKLPADIAFSSLVFGDLHGTGRDNSLVIADGHSHLVVYNEKLELLWERETDGGSHPLVYDMDGDGLDEILVGYSVFDHSGDRMFHTGAFIGDHCNGVAVSGIPVEGFGEAGLLYAAGDWGMMHVDFRGNIIEQKVLGHVSNLTVAELDMEKPGLEIVSSNAWGGKGLIHILAATGEVLADFVSEGEVSRCVPVNWKGDGEEFFLLSPDTIKGGLLDAEAKTSVVFPSDGHPESHHMVADLTGDARDELLVWDRNRMWIYTQDDNPRMGKTYNPQRIPLHNYSSSQMNISFPSW